MFLRRGAGTSDRFLDVLCGVFFDPRSFSRGGHQTHTASVTELESTIRIFTEKDFFNDGDLRPMSRKQFAERLRQRVQSHRQLTVSETNHARFFHHDVFADFEDSVSSQSRAWIYA